MSEPIEKPEKQDKPISNELDEMMWRFIDQSARYPQFQIDPRTWGHVLAYFPLKDKVLEPTFAMIDPDYARIYTHARITAWQYGFAMVVHGSMTRDLDLLLVPWEENACAASAEQVVRIIADAWDLKILGEPAVKPHGRRTYTLMLPGFAERRWVDLSIMPCVKPEPKTEVKD